MNSVIKKNSSIKVQEYRRDLAFDATVYNFTKDMFDFALLARYAGNDDNNLKINFELDRYVRLQVKAQYFRWADEQQKGSYLNYFEDLDLELCTNKRF